MPRESIYKKYEPANKPIDLTNTPSYLFIFKDHEMLMKVTDKDVNVLMGIWKN